MICWLFAPIATAADGSLLVLAGGRGNPERTLELPDAAESGELEPAALGAVIAGLTARPSDAVFATVQAEVWTYVPVTYASLLRVVPGVGAVLDPGSRGHVDAALRLGLEVAPGMPDADNVRSEATLAVGTDLGESRLDLVGAAVDREFPFEPLWTFRTLEGGLRLTSSPTGGLSLRVQATAQANQGFVFETGEGMEPASGAQARAQLAVRGSDGPWSLEIGYRPTYAVGGDDDEAIRPVLTPSGDYSEDADALSSGGFLQHRLDLVGSARLGEAWSVDLVGLLRLRDAAAADALATTRHARVDVARSVSERLALHLALGWTDTRTADGVSTLDPAGWMAIEVRPRSATASE